MIHVSRHGSIVHVRVIDFLFYSHALRCWRKGVAEQLNMTILSILCSLLPLAVVTVASLNCSSVTKREECGTFKLLVGQMV